MGILDNLKKQVIQVALKSALSRDVHLESALRTESKSKGISEEVKRESTVFTVKELKDWKVAVALATDVDNPSLSALASLYDHLRLDNHLVATIETRVYRALRSKFVFKSESGEENEELKVLFERPWFETFISEAIWSIFSGVKVIELADLDENLELIRVTNIPMQNLLPTKGLIVKEVGDATGWEYKEGVLAPYYIQIGENNDLGDLVNLTPMVLAKKLALGSWLDFIEKYGVPSIFITTDREDVQRFDELYEMAINMRSNNVAVLRGNEKITLSEASNTDAHKTFKELTAMINSEISKRILGQDGTTDSKDVSGNFGSLKILQEVANDRHESDKLFIENLINKELIPRLITLSSFYSVLNGYHFEWDNTEEVGKNEFLERAIKLSTAGFILDTEQITEKTGITILGVKNDSGTENSPGKKKR